MPDKNFVLQRDTLADKCMAADLAAASDFYAFLNFNKGSDFNIVTYLTPIQVGEPKYPNSFAQFYVGLY